jgi:hypothetical protein
MSDNLDYEVEQTGVPTFLKVLCILTFIGAGLGLLSALYGTFTVQASLDSLEKSSEVFKQMKSPMGDLSGQIEAIKKYGLISNIINLLANGLCLLGALMMWKLKKVGYFLYIGGHALAFTSSFLMMGSGNSGGLFGSMMILAMVIQLIFVAAFIIMYGVNYKHLKN